MERLEKLELTTLLERRIKSDLIEIDGIFNYVWHFFLIFLFEMEIYCHDRFQKLSLLTN